jgi:hypothetical protein
MLIGRDAASPPAPPANIAREKMPFGGQTACRAGVTKDIQDRHRRRARCVSARLLSVPA